MAKAKKKKESSVFDKPATFAGSPEQAVVPSAVKAGSRKKTVPPFASAKGVSIIKK